MSSKKPSAPKSCFLLLTSDGIITLRTNEHKTISKHKKISRYSYLSIESVHRIETSSPIPGIFQFRLHFYNKDLDKKKAKSLLFTCEDQASPEEIKSKQSWLKVAGMQEGAKQKPLEFNILYLIERQLPIIWQRVLEAHLGMSPTSQQKLCNYDEDDCYQFHGYVKKKNRWTFYDNRFIVLTLKWMINADASFEDTKCTQFKFKKLLWRAPLAALRVVEITREGEFILIKMKFDNQKQIEILEAHKYKTDKTAKIKEKRKLLFGDVVTA